MHFEPCPGPRTIHGAVHSIKSKRLKPEQPPACHNSNMLVLASASPRCRELLAQAGYTFQVHPAHIPEDPLAEARTRLAT